MAHYLQMVKLNRAIVQLSEDVIQRAYDLGDKRRTTSASMRLTQRRAAASATSDALIQRDRIGAAGEFAVALYLGLPLPDTCVTEPYDYSFKAPDLVAAGIPIDVRSCSGINYRLIIRENDSDDIGLCAVHYAQQDGNHQRLAQKRQRWKTTRIPRKLRQLW